MSRLYTLLLATMAGAGMTLALTLICCVIKTYLEQRREQRRQSTPVPWVTRPQPHPQRSRRETRSAYLSGLDTAMLSRAALPPPPPHVDVATLVAYEDATRKKAGTDLHASANQESHTQVSESDTPVGNHVAGSSSSLPGDRHRHLEINKDGVSREHNPQEPSLNSQLADLLNSLGGIEALITATSTVHEGTTDVYLGRGEDDPSVVFGRERLQISAAAACALRMVALSEIGGNPMLAYLPPPWTREHMELRLQLASDDRKVAQPDEHGTCAADARDGDGRSSSTSDVSEDRETEMEAEAEDIREANEAQEDSRDDDESWGEQGAGSAPGAMSVEMQQVSRVIPGVEGTAQVQPDQEAGSSAGKAAMGQPTSPSKTGWRALRGLNLRSTSRSCKGSLQCSAGSFLKHMMLEDIKPDATGRCHLILHGGSLLGTQQQSKLWGQPVVLYQFQQGFKKQLMRLCTLLEGADHPCVFVPLAICPLSGMEAVLMPLSDSCNLEEALGGTDATPSGSQPARQCPPMPWQARLAVAYDLVLGLWHLQSHWEHPLVHGSIHPCTVRISSSFQACLEHPGFLPASMTPAEKGIEEAGPERLRGPATLLPGLLPLVMHFSYLDPQYHKRGQFTPPADVYALGVILLKLLTALPAKGIVTVAKEAFKQEMLEDVLDPAAGEWPQRIAHDLMELALSCCERRHTRRCKLQAESVNKLQFLIIDTFKSTLVKRGVPGVMNFSTPSSRWGIDPPGTVSDERISITIEPQAA